MSINEREVEHLKVLLEKAKKTGNNNIIEFAKENLFPEYLECGIGWEQVEIDKELCEYFEKFEAQYDFKI